MKLPDDAFSYYVSLGSERSYEAVAKHYGVAKRTVVRVAGRESWMERLSDIQKSVRDETDRQLEGHLAVMDVEHRKMLLRMRGISVLALERLTSNIAELRGMDAVRAAEVVIKLERIVAGLPAEHGARRIQQTVLHLRPSDVVEAKP